MALPALVVLALVAVVAVASSGSSVDAGTDRAPSATLLDTLLSVWFVAVVAGAILVAYGLVQRRAIANEIASGRYRRMSIVGYLGFFIVFTAVSYWRLSTWKVHQPKAPNEPAFSGAPPTQTTPSGHTEVAYQPGISWIAIGVVVTLCIAVVVAYVIAERRARRRPGRERALAEQLAAALDESLDDLRAEADPRRAVIAAYARLERVLSANGVARRASETPDEYLPRVLRGLELDPRAVERLTSLFDRAKFSHHDVDSAMKEEAIEALEAVRNELRLARELREHGSATQHTAEAIP